MIQAKEIEVDLPIQASIADKIETLKNEAIAMTKRLEDEKLKNVNSYIFSMNSRRSSHTSDTR